MFQEIARCRKSQLDKGVLKARTFISHLCDVAGNSFLGVPWGEAARHCARTDRNTLKGRAPHVNEARRPGPGAGLKWLLSQAGPRDSPEVDDPDAESLRRQGGDVGVEHTSRKS